MQRENAISSNVSPVVERSTAGLTEAKFALIAEHQLGLVAESVSTCNSTSEPTDLTGIIMVVETNCSAPSPTDSRDADDDDDDTDEENGRSRLAGLELLPSRK
mmetsp:Transcript_6526/g.17486  ORF Transcript_6526/g.17486 Transcript_6526/m.17486 type:complete len:103 (-) Transcript_6526:290-598(-)